MATLELNKDNFEATITNNDMVLIDFWAPWCGPCKSFGPIYDAVSEKHPEIVFGKVNTEEQQELAGAFGVQSIPTLMVFREQILLFSQPGALPANVVEDLISKIQQLDMDGIRAEIAAKEAAEADAAT